MAKQIQSDTSTWVQTESDLKSNTNDGTTEVRATRIANINPDIGYVDSPEAGSDTGSFPIVGLLKRLLNTKLAGHLATIAGAVTGGRVQSDAVVTTLPTLTESNTGDILAQATAILADTAAIDTNVSTLAGAVTAAKFQSDVLSLPGTVQTDIAAILADTASIDTNLGVIASAVSGAEVQVDVLTLPATPAGENHIGAIAGNTEGFPGVKASYTRPADTTAYTAGDAIANSTTAPAVLTFTNLARVSGGSGYISGARLRLSQANFDGTIALFLYRTSPTATNDNAVLTFPANDDNYIGRITFASADLEGTTFTPQRINGTFGKDRLLPFRCAGGDRNIYGIVGAAVGFTPTSAGTFEFYLAVEQN